MIEDIQVHNETENPKVQEQKEKHSLYKSFEKSAEYIKIVLQMIIGAIITFIIIIKIINVIFNVEFFVSADNVSNIGNAIKMPILTMVSGGLAAATGLELGYMLFTDGPDEAIQPVLMAIASFIIYQLSLNPEIGWSEGLGLGILLVFIPILLETDKRYNKNKDENKDKG